MKSIRTLLLFAVVTGYVVSVTGCAPKYGCPSNGKNVGAERILSGEKVPKGKKFRS